MLRRLRLALALLVPAVALQAQAAPLTVVVVRHAEKGPETPDPDLSDAGRQRAAALTRTLTDFHPTALFASEFKRTQQTLGPLATTTGVTPTVVPARDLDALVVRLRALPAGSRAVVASHSNLVHLIVQKLCGVLLAELTDADYDRLMVVTVTGEGKGSVVVLRYGDR